MNASACAGGRAMWPALVVSGLIFAVALSIPLWHRKEVLTGNRTLLKAVLPVAPGSWSSREVPLGATEAVQGAVEKALKFDDYFFREYRSARGSFSVYIAYWGPGKMPTQLVASHTPDRCWTESGWSCEQLLHKANMPGFENTVKPGEWRLFATPDGTRLQVQYWHLVNGRLYDYGSRFNRVPSIWRWWRDAMRQTIEAPPEQYFIRISSDLPFDKLKGDPGWEELVAALAKLGLAEAPPDGG